MGFSSTFYCEEYGTTCKLIGAAVIPKRWDSDFAFAFAFAFVFVVDFDFDFASFSAWNIVHTGDDRIHFFFFCILFVSTPSRGILDLYDLVYLPLATLRLRTWRIY